MSTSPKQWFNLCHRLQFHRYFSNKAKEIRFHELLHIHYVLNRPVNRDLIPGMSPNVLIQNFNLKHLTSVKLFSSKIDISILDYSLRKVKKIYPYTSPSRTVIKVLEHSLNNMSTPITQHVSCKDYSLKKLKHQ